jgi:hypothetical protein
VLEHELAKDLAIIDRAIAQSSFPQPIQRIPKISEAKIKLPKTKTKTGSPLRTISPEDKTPKNKHPHSQHGFNTIEDYLSYLGQRFPKREHAEANLERVTGWADYPNVFKGKALLKDLYTSGEQRVKEDLYRALDLKLMCDDAAREIDRNEIDPHTGETNPPTPID